jgi:hypothetical protein
MADTGIVEGKVSYMNKLRKRFGASQASQRFSLRTPNPVRTGILGSPARGRDGVATPSLASAGRTVKIEAALENW